MDIISKPTRMERNGKAKRARTDQHANGRMGKQARKVIREVQQMSDTATDVAQERLGYLRESASEYKRQGQDKAQNMERSIERFIQEHPVRTVLIAAGAGLFLGCFWMRR